MNYENKIVKKPKTTTKWITCLDNIRISRVLQLIELFPDGLLQRDIFSLLDAPKDKGIMQALKELEHHGFIRKENKMRKPIEAVNDETRIKGKRIIKDITYGLETKRDRYFSTGNPIRKLFDKLLEEVETEEQNKYFSLIARDISTRWQMINASYSFNTKYISPQGEENDKQILYNLNKAAELYEGEQLEQARKDRDQIIQDYLKLRQDETEYKKEKQMEQINGLRFKTQTHVDYITLQLQRILVEMFIHLYTNYYHIKETKIDKQLINTIEQVLYAIKPELEQVAMIHEITDRIKNFENLLKLRNINKKINIDKQVKK